MLKFAAFTSDIELPFYAALASHKINHDKLDDSKRHLLGLYEIRPHDPPEASCRLQLHGNALTTDITPAAYCRAEGTIKNVNTIEEYRSIDKSSLLSQAARTIWDAINDGTIFSCPSLLATFSIICFADLKRYKFTYLSAFPALHADPAWKIANIAKLSVRQSSAGDDANISRLESDETAILVERVQTWRHGVNARQHGFFLAKKMRSIATHDVSAEQNSRSSLVSDVQDRSSTTSNDVTDELDHMWEVASLEAYENGFFDSTNAQDRFVCFADPSTYPTVPGWMLRNLLVLIGRRWKLSQVQILCYRDIYARRHDARSIILTLEAASPDLRINYLEDSQRQEMRMPRCTGWERNNLGKVVNRVANLGEHMDPRRLADQAVDLNLKLIKWRIAPRIDLEKIKTCKCLLLGAGTLGSHVARNLMSWGVHKITFVDSGSIAFSNPIRQSLFKFVDCEGGSVKKAIRAAEALKEIYPGVDSSGYVVSVPMAGHPILDEAKTRLDYDLLERLFDDHDAIFLLTDTRESRWLPSVMGKAKGKLIMNAALGFESFLVMRHGTYPLESQDQELGCYFCSDVVAPTDSLSDRTLDQQCTVTRPGVAAIASALIVEILVSVLQHSEGKNASAPRTSTDDSGNHPLGIVPHQIRGSLSNFQNIVIRGRSYDCCSACSKNVVEAYRTDGWQFVVRALNDSNYIENLSGLTEVHKAAEAALASMEVNDTEGMSEGEGEMI